MLLSPNWLHDYPAPAMMAAINLHDEKLPSLREKLLRHPETGSMPNAEAGDRDRHP